MAIIKLEIDIQEKDRDLISKLGSIAAEYQSADERAKAAENRAKIDQENAHIYAVRGRTVDQIKRLYAVVMGFALTTCFANAFLCVRRVDPAEARSYIILCVAVFCFVSLISLFYLGAERMLEAKYLGLKSRPAKPRELLGDIATLWVTAAIFVVIANSFPETSQSKPLAPGAVDKFLAEFIWYLAALYVADILFLWLQWDLLDKDEVPHPELIGAHKCWLICNGVALLAMLAASAALWFSYVSEIWIAVGIAVVHAVRFWQDYTRTFHAYFPQAPIVEK